MSAKKPPATAVTLLLYWLIVLCGLEGVTIVRSGTDTNELAALWAGTLAGVFLGQVFSWTRLRLWLLAPVAIAALWVAPIAYLGLWEIFHGATSTFVIAFLPSIVCGYLSLSERGALASLWFPTVLWMLFILDGQGSTTTFDARDALPYLLGLGVLFVAFLRVRATRRVALWQSHATVRLAVPVSRTVLRASPLRAAPQLAWTTFVGGAALVLAAWVAPQLWQREHQKTPAAWHGARASGDVGAQSPCCPAQREEKRVVVREYLPLQHGADEADRERAKAAACTPCLEGAGTGTSGAGDGIAASGVVGDGITSTPVSGGGTVTWSAGPPSQEPRTTFAEPSPPRVETATPPLPLPPGSKPSIAPRHAPQAAPTATDSGPLPPIAYTPPTPATSSTPAAVVVAPRPVAVTPSSRTHYESTLALVATSSLFLFVVGRALRRALTLRHLERPLWAETLDQRISNHWQRMLVGLRDAGIRPARDEQPQAFAARVAIADMGTCATILERVRHGVRVDAGDLDAMKNAASAVYAKARCAAGFSGRAASWLRWPLA